MIWYYRAGNDDDGDDDGDGGGYEGDDDDGGMVMMTKQLTDATVEPRLKSPGDKLQLGEPAQQQPPPQWG